MALLEIKVWPDAALSEVGEAVADFSQIPALAASLFATMYDANGIGLAATQCAVRQRVLVLDLDPHGEAKTDPEVQADLEAWNFQRPMVFVNPTLVRAEGSVLWDEGCLSVPGVTEQVQRREHVWVRAQDVDGVYFEVEAHGLYAVALQHEMDHLDGKVFVEYLSNLKRNVIRRKMERLKAEGIDDGAGAPL
jgi:peptide deformylase